MTELLSQPAPIHLPEDVTVGEADVAALEQSYALPSAEPGPEEASRMSRRADRPITTVGNPNSQLTITDGGTTSEASTTQRRADRPVTTIGNPDSLFITTGNEVGPSASPSRENEAAMAAGIDAANLSLQGLRARLASRKNGTERRDLIAAERALALKSRIDAMGGDQEEVAATIASSDANFAEEDAKWRATRQPHGRHSALRRKHAIDSVVPTSEATTQVIPVSAEGGESPVASTTPDMSRSLEIPVRNHDGSLNPAAFKGITEAARKGDIEAGVALPAVPEQASEQGIEEQVAVVDRRPDGNISGLPPRRAPETTGSTESVDRADIDLDAAEALGDEWRAKRAASAPRPAGSQGQMSGELSDGNDSDPAPSRATRTQQPKRQGVWARARAYRRTQKNAPRGLPQL